MNLLPFLSLLLATGSDLETECNGGYFSFKVPDTSTVNALVKPEDRVDSRSSSVDTIDLYDVEERDSQKLISKKSVCTRPYVYGGIAVVGAVGVIVGVLKVVHAF